MEMEWKEVEVVVQEDQARIRLDQFLVRRFSIINRSGWQERIDAGLVQVNEAKARPSRKLHTGDRIRIEFQKKPEPDVIRDVEIVHRDDCILVVNKPPNLPVHPSGIYYKNTLAHILIDRFSQDPEHPYRPRPVHRLDRETSGLMLLAESNHCAGKLARAMQSDKIQKEYLVIVEGRFDAGPGEWRDATGWIGADPESEVRKKQRFWDDAAERPAEARSCRTEFRVIQYSGPLTLLHCRLHTGRMHQIRATLHSLGYPVVGDRLYGVDSGLYLKFIYKTETQSDLERLRMNRVALHSHRLRFNHPDSGKAMDFECALPDDMQVVLNQ
ncbi:MAG: RluA family pseudouridine synthase [Leptospiraceae bacterium]|nr:RluA family pseudouridine synthase [Leptospiraceae bacterium]